MLGNTSLGLVTEASVDLMGASCAGVLVRHCLWGCAEQWPSLE